MGASKSIGKLALSGLVITAAFACGAESPGSEADCQDSFKCDIPEGPAEKLCVQRRLDAFNENQYAYQPEQLRWSCADVSGVTGSDRGQEYCEYFAMVQLPAQESSGPAILGRNLGEDYTFGTTEERLDLSSDDLAALEQDESAIVGQCVFTSWNSDIEGPVAACANPKEETCPTVLGVPIAEENFRMKFGVNSAEAAQILVDDCMAELPAAGDLENPADPLHDDFYRACMFNEKINETAFRKSDTTVCSAAVRLKECGCGPVDPELNLAEYISPYNRLGFPLGTWSDPFGLPAGCRYLDEGEGSDTLVTCDLSAAEVISGAYDLKGFCMQKYADNVVVHVPLPPAEAVSCDPSASESPYAGTCSDTPWILEPSVDADRY